MKIKTIKTRIFKPDENLFHFMEDYISIITEKSILVVTSKIVALSEGRAVEKVDDRTKEKLIASESDFVLPTKYVCLTIKDGVVMANAGIDESNANGKLILLPRDSFKSAEFIRRELCKKFKIKNLGVLITDSRLFPLRAGVVGVALGYAGFKGIRDYRGTSDIFGERLEISRTDVADSLATAAVLCMGEGSERRPLAIISNAPVEYSDRLDRDELKIDIKEDIYKPLFEQIM